MGLDTSEFEKRYREIEAQIDDDPEAAYEVSKELKKDVDNAISKYKKKQAKKEREERERQIREEAAAKARADAQAKAEEEIQKIKETAKEEVKEEAVERAKEELSQDIDFVTEIIEKAPEIIPNLSKKKIERAKKLLKLKKEMGVKEGTIYIVGEYECPHCKKHYLIKCNGKKDWVE